MKGIFSYPRKGISFILFLSLIFILQGGGGSGGGGSSSSSGSSSTSGQALIGLTDLLISPAASLPDGNLALLPATQSTFMVD